MTIRHLKIFITVAKYNSMNQAAKELYISQPTISQAIKDIEEEYTIQLFERLGKKLYITKAGEKLLTYAHDIISLYDKMEKDIKNESIHPTIRVGTSISVGTSLINSITKQCKDIDLSIHVHITQVIEKMLLENEIDVALIEGLTESEDLIKIPFSKDELLVLSGPKHPLAKKKHLTVQDLNNQNYISREDGSVARNQYEVILSQKNIQLHRTFVSSSTEAIKNALKQNTHISILSSLLVQEELKKKELCVLPLDLHVYRDINIVYHKNKYMSPSLLSFIKQVQSTNT